MHTHPQNALQILQLLLRCGMICREELNVVLEMMAAVSGDAASAARESDHGGAQSREMPKPQPGQKNLILEAESRV